jgi:hypothetical protein
MRYSQPRNPGRVPSLLLLGALAAVGGCQSLNEPIYFNGTQLVAMGGEPLPVSNGITLVYRNPTQQEQKDLDAQTTAANYGGDVPWVAGNKIHLELSFRVTNTSGKDGKFDVLVDGASQYEKYDSKTVGMALQKNPNDPITLLPLMESSPQMLAAGKSFSGLLREDDFNEAQLDLDALARWNDAVGKTFAAVLINRSDVYPPGTQPVGMSLVPGFRVAMGGVGVDPAHLVVPAFVEVDVNLQSDVAMTCDYVLRVRDDDDRLFHDPADSQFQTTPTLFAPTIM